MAGRTRSRRRPVGRLWRPRVMGDSSAVACEGGKCVGCGPCSCKRACADACFADRRAANTRRALLQLWPQPHSGALTATPSKLGSRTFARRRKRYGHTGRETSFVPEHRPSADNWVPALLDRTASETCGYWTMVSRTAALLVAALALLSGRGAEGATCWDGFQRSAFPRCLQAAPDVALHWAVADAKYLTVGLAVDGGERYDLAEVDSRFPPWAAQTATHQQAIATPHSLSTSTVTQTACKEQRRARLACAPCHVRIALRSPPVPPAPQPKTGWPSG